MLFEHRHEDTHVATDLARWWAQFAAWRERIPFHIKDGRQCALGLGHIFDEPTGLHAGWRTKVVEVVGADGDICAPCTAPVRCAHRVEQITTFCGFNKGEADTSLMGFAPVYTVLKSGGVDAVNRELMWRGRIEDDGVIVVKLGSRQSWRAEEQQEQDTQTNHRQHPKQEECCQGQGLLTLGQQCCSASSPARRINALRSRLL